jgi:hypothetical protein
MECIPIQLYHRPQSRAAFISSNKSSRHTLDMIQQIFQILPKKLKAIPVIFSTDTDAVRMFCTNSLQPQQKVPQTTNSGRKVVHVVQQMTKITIDICFQGSSCVVRGRQILLSVSSTLVKLRVSRSTDWHFYCWLAFHQWVVQASQMTCMPVIRRRSNSSADVSFTIHAFWFDKNR